MNNGPTTRTRLNRIPTTLQAVFIASNRGKEVNRPPPKQVAHRVFFQNWFWQRKKNNNKTGKVGRHQAPTKHKGDPPSVGPHTLDKSSKILGQKKGKDAASPKEIHVTKVEEVIAPQDYLDNMLEKRGYSTKRFKTLQTAYYNKPTALQQASYDVYLINLVKRGDTPKLKAIAESGVSPNPCNQYGESLVHMICRRGDVEMLQVLIDVGCDLQVADDYGRTPLHDACWAAKPAFGVVDLILDVDPRLFFMTDTRGSTPLTYVRKTHWEEWNPYLNKKAISVWPDRGVSAPEQEDPERAQLGANTRPLQNPEDALTCELANMVACGKMHPEEAALLKYDNEESSTADQSEEDYSDDYFSESGSEGSDDDSDYDEDYDDEGSDFSLDEDEMADILNTLSTPNKQ